MSVPDVLLSLIESSGTSGCFPPTDVFNEGWMLRIVMELHSRGLGCFPFSRYEGSGWLSEVQLLTPFAERYRGDLLYEKRTHADGVIGHIKIDDVSKTGLEIRPSAGQFIVLEAKMFSGLSGSVKNARGYDQAARNLACMSQCIKESGNIVDSFDSLGFFVVAPEAQIQRGIFDRYLERDNVLDTVRKRVDQYSGESVFHKLDTWYTDEFCEFIEKVQIDKISWEQIIENISESVTRDAVSSFYESCLRFNRYITDNR
jgi:hypothetical protein